MLARLADRVEDVDAVHAHLIADNRVPLEDDAAHRVIAVNVLHEIRGENALAEMGRLLAPGGFVLVVDWERGRPRDTGPPGELLYTAAEAVAGLERAGGRRRQRPASLPFRRPRRRCLTVATQETS